MTEALDTFTDQTVCVVGGGYVGLVTAACLAEAGRQVRVVEVDLERLRALQKGQPPFHEPGLRDLLDTVVSDHRLQPTADLKEGMRDAGIAIIAVGTPPRADGNADLSQVRRAVSHITAVAPAGVVICVKSTVPPGTTISLERNTRRGPRQRPHFVSCPEFLREGKALEDFRNPARLVIGGTDPSACARVEALFAGLPGRRIVTDPTSAEMIKYGANAFLALKISFINEIAHLCELAGGDIDSVAEGIGADARIGRAFLDAGLGFGGSCFPKDIRALDETAGYLGQSFWLLKAAIEVNAQQRRRFVAKILSALRGRVSGKRIAILGLAFKPGTDDVRQAASIDVVRHLQDLGATVVATDPEASGNARTLLPDVRITGDPYDCVAGADAIGLVTEWPAYVDLDWARVAGLVRRRIVVDGRNCLDAEQLIKLGFEYFAMGRARARVPQRLPANVPPLSLPWPTVG